MTAAQHPRFMNTPSYQNDPQYHADALANDLNAILVRLSSIRFEYGDAMHVLMHTAVRHLRDYAAYTDRQEQPPSSTPS